MSVGSILKPGQFDPSTFEFTSVRVNSYNGKEVYVNHDNHKVRIMTPKLYCPWGLSTYPMNDPNPQSYYLVLQFPKGMNEKMQTFHDQLVAYDEHVIKTGMERSQEWFGRKNMKEPMMREFYSPFVKKHMKEDGTQYPDTITLKLRFKNDRFAAKCFKGDKEPADILEAIKKGCYIKAVMELNGVYLKKNQGSASATALQLKVYPPTRLTGYAFIPDEDDDEIVNIEEAADGEDEEDGEEENMFQESDNSDEESD